MACDDQQNHLNITIFKTESYLWSDSVANTIGYRPRYLKLQTPELFERHQMICEVFLFEIVQMKNLSASFNKQKCYRLSDSTQQSFILSLQRRANCTDSLGLQQK